MTPKLPTDLSEAVDASANGSLEVVHPGTNRTYFIVDGDAHREAMDALRERQRVEDHEAIAEGIAQMEAGEGVPLDEAFEAIRSRLQLPQRQS